MRFPVRAFGVAIVWLATFAGGSTVPPSASYVAQLPDGAHLHMLPLPLGRLDGTLSGSAIFDSSGTRAVFIATFPGATLTGDWRTLDPSQAFELDANSRKLTQLTIDGAARAVVWENDQTVGVLDGDRRNRYPVARAVDAPLPDLRMADATSIRAGSIVAQGGDGRFFVVKTSAGRYGLQQIGARALRYRATASNGAYAIIGNFLVWVDHSKGQGNEIARGGALALAPPSFAGSAYGDALTPIMPLGHAVYQGAYRNGSIYFAFTNGMRRVVAQSSDLASYSFPQVPNDLSYSTGDGIGAAASGQLYFAWPEGGEITFWRDGRYVKQDIRLPLHTSNETDLDWAMARIAPGDPLWPPLRPDEDALDAALLQWRVYPVGDTIGDVWIASYLGHLLVGDSHGNFKLAATPVFPFALLGRTDDGRIWAAAPQLRLFTQSIFADATSSLWWSRDGVAWLEAQTLPGDAGAVGLDHRRPWVALTKPWLGRSAIWVMRVGDSTAAITGGTYGGEQLFFASLPESFYLIWGATPGRRLGGDQGPLCAYRVDQAALFTFAGGLNIFQQQFSDPSDDPALASSTFDIEDATALVQPTLQALASLSGAEHAVLATNVDGVSVDQSRVTLMTVDQERAFEIKYAGRPYPLATVRAQINGDLAVVTRSFARGPLTQSGSLEHWMRVAGEWKRSSILRY